jgi:hypothetical protein
MADFSNNQLLSGLIIAAEFGLLLVLGFVFMRLLYWHSCLVDNQAQWLAACRQGVRQLRVFRRQLEKVDGDMLKLPMSRSLRHKMSVILWAGKAFSVSKSVRS